MTDVRSEAFGQKLNARTEFNNEPVWLPLLAVHALNQAEPILSGKTFTRCRIQGPAVVAIMGSTTFEGCNMGRVTDPRSLTFLPQGPLLVGVIGLKDCKFVECEFDFVGFAGPQEVMDDFAQTLIAAREAQG